MKNVGEKIEEIKLNDKNWIEQFKNNHPDIFKESSELEIKNFEELCEFLIKKLDLIMPGTDAATIYHKTILGILELLFYPILRSPELEEKIHDGRKRIDITFDNCAESGFFFRLSNSYGLPSQFISVECKNYSRDIANPELDQIAGRFSPSRGKVGIVVCRKIEDFALFIMRCNDTYKDDRGLIIPIVDNDLTYMLSNYKKVGLNVWEGLLQERYHSIVFS